MEFVKLPTNSKKLLDEIVCAENPTQLLSNRFDGASGREDEELRSLIKELCQEGYISIPMWANNRPYHVIVNNSARTYDERLKEYERSIGQQPYAVLNQSVSIGNGNKIIHSSISGDIEQIPEKTHSDAKGSFYTKHPIICAFLISFVAGLILLFSFWEKIITYVEGMV